MAGDRYCGRMLALLLVALSLGLSNFAVCLGAASLVWLERYRDFLQPLT